MVERHLRVAPEYYITDVQSCTDDFGLSIMQAINDRATAIINSERIDDFYRPTVRSRKSINSGHCEDVTVYVYDTVVEEGFDETRIAIVNRVFLPYGESRQQHSWIAYCTPEGDVYHFDSEAPWGVRPWYYLPSIHRNPQALEETAFHYADPRDDPHNLVRGIYGMQGEINDAAPAWFDEA